MFYICVKFHQIIMIEFQFTGGFIFYNVQIVITPNV